MLPTRCLEQSVRFFAADHLVLALRHVYQGSIWTSTDGKVLAVPWPQIIVFRPSRGKASSMMVKVFNWKTGLLWYVFFVPETVPRRCFTGLIPAHRERNSDLLMSISSFFRSFCQLSLPNTTRFRSPRRRKTLLLRNSLRMRS